MNMDRFISINTFLFCCNVFQKKLKKFKFDYELDKAKLADDNDERLDTLNDQLDLAKKNIRQAVHHLKLDEYLQKGFEKLDEIETGNI